jgi:hypothetical protein
LCLCGESRAIDPEAKTPYQVRLVLTVAEHRMLTPGFQKQLEADLRDQVQLALGKLASVEVVRGHPLLKEVRARGLQAALGGWDELSPVQTHFVLVDFADGRYRVETGWHDGMTGLSGPAVRHAAVGDAGRVADAAARLILGDFAAVGSFQKLDGNEVSLTLKGGGLGETLGPWVKVGDAFAVVRLTEENGHVRASPVEWALLQVTEAPKDGAVRCRYACRYEDDFNLTDAPPVAGYRCVRLPTRPGPVKIRLVDDKTQELLSGFRVAVAADPDFKSIVAEHTTFQGLFEEAGPLGGVVYVRVLTGKTPLIEFPLALVDERTVVCYMAKNDAAVKAGEVETRRQRWVRWSNEALAATDQRIAAFNTLITPKTLEQAFKAGKDTLDALEADQKRLAAERAAIEKLAAKVKLDGPLDVAEGKQVADALARRHDGLKKSLAKLDQSIKAATSDETKALQAEVARAELLEKQAEFEKALEIYDKVLKAANDPDLKAHADQLRAAWAAKGKEHGQARQFIYETWPALDPLGLKANLAKARDALQRCKDAGDHKTPLKLVLANVQHAAALTKELARLRKAADSPDNRADIKSLVQASMELNELQTDAVAWVAQDKKAK